MTFLNAVCLLASLFISAALGSQTCSTFYDTTSSSPLRTATVTSTSIVTKTTPIFTVTVTKLSGTTTIPTSPGFTPILSETTTTSGLPPSFTTAVISGGYFVGPTTVTCSTTTTITTTITLTTTAKPPSKPPTVTTTVPAATTYAACSSDNILDHGLGPNGGGVGHAIEDIALTTTAYTVRQVSNQTAYSCCVECQTNYPCAFSYLAQQATGSGNIPICYLVVFTELNCLGSRAGPAAFYWQYGSPQGPGEGLTLSNGVCGEVIDGGIYCGWWYGSKCKIFWTNS